MKIKNLALATAALLGLVGAPATFACSIAAWNGTVGGTPVAGRPTDATSVPRYSGQCGLRAAASGSFVADNTPTAEPAFRARFYVYTGLTSGSAVVYRALNASNAEQISVTYNQGSPGTFSFAIPGATAQTVPANTNAWYSIELNWANTGTLSATVRGAAGTADATASITGGTAGGAIDTAQLGWISGTGVAGARAIVADAYESRRSTAIGRLCRGDANNDGTRNSGDGISIRNEFLSATLAAGQPDANEDGSVNSGDGIIVRNLFLGGQGACTSGV
ncbi:MAG: hypothetical protein LW860_18415 [Xanthomonadaceae bacterium]|nr:hypothetical protein [Xanthomonadaceae bacterium]